MPEPAIGRNMSGWLKEGAAGGCMAASGDDASILEKLRGKRSPDRRRESSLGVGCLDRNGRHPMVSSGK